MKRYYCPYPTHSCVRSKKQHLCCHECDRFGKCSVQCDTVVASCKAKQVEEEQKMNEAAIVECVRAVCVSIVFCCFICSATIVLLKHYDNNKE